MADRRVTTGSDVRVTTAGDTRVVAAGGGGSVSSVQLERSVRGINRGLNRGLAVFAFVVILLQA